MEMKISTVPKDKVTFAIDQSIFGDKEKHNGDRDQSNWEESRTK